MAEKADERIIRKCSDKAFPQPERRCTFEHGIPLYDKLVSGEEKEKPLWQLIADQGEMPVHHIELGFSEEEKTGFTGGSREH